MIEKVLDFSKLESGEMSVCVADCPADPVLNEAVTGLGPWARKCGLTLTAEPAPGLVVLADRLRLIEILNNLISNAIKAAPGGGRITASARRGAGEQRGHAVFSVCDTGPGLAKGDLERIFEKFVQVGSSTEGVGLGLSIVRDLVRLHGGRAWAESEPGRGATFSFTIPLASVAGGAKVVGQDLPRQ